MCGLAGTHRRRDLDVARMLDRIAHRGPDDRGIFETRDAVHGHVRLSLLDPTPASSQPFLYEGSVLSYNGELWNYRGLRADLEDEGVVFKTTGDTEVVAAALHRWDLDAFERMHGMYALAHTRADGSTILARDPMGVIPLYVSHSMFGTAWASERKAFPDLDARLLPPGTIYVVEDHETLAFDDGHYSVHTGRYRPEDVRAALRAATHDRLQADVPVCCLISGGLDSSLVLALVKEVKDDVVAYTVYHGEETEDLLAAREACEHLEVPLQEVHVPEIGEEQVVEAVKCIEVPNKTQVEIATLSMPLARAIASDGYKACLTGETADELFGGYATLARKAKKGHDERWRSARIEFLAKMARSDYLRTNKTLMSAGVEGRLPFDDRRVVRLALSATLAQCPAGKGLLKEAARGMLPNSIIDRPKLTFQRGGGSKEACERLGLNYNDICVEHYGRGRAKWIH